MDPAHGLYLQYTIFAFIPGGFLLNGGGARGGRGTPSDTDICFKIHILDPYPCFQIGVKPSLKIS